MLVKDNVEWGCMLVKDEDGRVILHRNKSRFNQRHGIFQIFEPMSDQGDTGERAGASIQRRVQTFSGTSNDEVEEMRDWYQNGYGWRGRTIARESRVRRRV